MNRKKNGKFVAFCAFCALFWFKNYKNFEFFQVRVPTHENGSCLFWEFATDHYDIGFGVYFEWTVADSNQVSVHVSESDDEEDYDEALEAEQAEAGGGGGGAAGQGGPGDVEAGAMQTRQLLEMTELLTATQLRAERLEQKILILFFGPDFQNAE